MSNIIDWSWRNHTGAVRHRVRLGRVTAEKEMEIWSWLSDNIPARNRLSFHGEHNDFYFVNLEDAIHFKLRWIE